MSSDVGASADATPLTVFGAPALSIEAEPNLVAPGGEVELQLTLEHAAFAQAATDVSFSLDPSAALPGATLLGLPLAEPCGPGSELSVSLGLPGALSLSAGQLDPGASCSFAVTLQLPTDAELGSHELISSPVSATVASQSTSNDAASLNLEVTRLDLELTFDAPVVAGGQVDLDISLENLDAARSLEELAFDLDLDAALSGLSATGLPLDDVCGSGSRLEGDGTLTLSGGGLAPGAACSFSVTLAVPESAPTGAYPVSTGPISASAEGTPLSFPGSGASLLVGPPPALSVSWQPRHIAVGETSQLNLIIDNAQSALPAQDSSLSLQLPPGLEVATPPNAATTCTGATLSASPGTPLITQSGATLPALDACLTQLDILATESGAYTLSATLDSTNGEAVATSSELRVDPAPDLSPDAGATPAAPPEDEPGNGNGDPDPLFPGAPLPDAGADAGPADPLILYDSDCSCRIIGASPPPPPSTSGSPSPSQPYATGAASACPTTPHRSGSRADTLLLPGETIPSRRTARTSALFVSSAGTRLLIRFARGGFLAKLRTAGMAA